MTCSASPAMTTMLPRRMVVSELAGVPLLSVAVARVSYAVTATTPPAGRRLRRLLSDGYSTLLVRVSFAGSSSAVSISAHGDSVSDTDTDTKTDLYMDSKVRTAKPLHTTVITAAHATALWLARRGPRQACVQCCSPILPPAQVEATVLAADLQVSKQVLIGISAQVRPSLTMLDASSLFSHLSVVVSTAGRTASAAAMAGCG